MQNQKSLFLTIGVLAIVLVGVLAISQTWKGGFGGGPGITVEPTDFSRQEFRKFTSDEEFRSYLSEAQQFSSGLTANVARDVVTDESVGLGQAEAIGPIAPVVERVSETNVQVKGIDEPDLVKTNGQQLFISSDRPEYRALEPQPLELQPLDDSLSPRIFPPTVPTTKTTVVQAWPLDQLVKTGSIDRSGTLLLYNHRLVVFSNPTGDADQRLTGYDVATPASPKESWAITLDSRETMEAARLLNGQIYLVTRRSTFEQIPCPFEVLRVNGKPLSIPCEEVYRPGAVVPVDATFTAMVIDPGTGEVNRRVSFVGSSQSGVVFLSPEALYVAYAFSGDPVEFFSDFFNQDGRDLVPDRIRERLKTLQSYDLSASSKTSELFVILEQHQRSLSEAESLKLENEMSNRLKSFSAKYQRRFERTGIVKIDLADFGIEATGEVPGRPLNQFSLDEHQGTLRIATTSSGGTLFFGSSQSVNDVYTLDKNLRPLGSVLDLGKGERIYSVRFIGDRGYVVTFRQVDPFYVLDLHDPKSPQRTGELKIPGYSSYLHPLDDDHILGVGRDGSNVKMSVFDVRDPSQPTESAQYQLADSWSEIEQTHHAFLHDQKFKAFFLPASRGGYVFTYTDNSLTLSKAVPASRAKRAVYINDYLFLITETNIVVLRGGTWEIQKELAL